MTSFGEVRGLVSAPDASLIDLVDHVLNKGVSLTGEVVLGIAGVDLVYLRLSALLCAADRLFPRPWEDEGTWPFQGIRARPSAARSRPSVVRAAAARDAPVPAARRRSRRPRGRTGRR
jgi:gas vesicle protein GvpA/GvpJ/GvpM family